MINSLKTLKLSHMMFLPLDLHRYNLLLCVQGVVVFCSPISTNDLDHNPLDGSAPLDGKARRSHLGGRSLRFTVRRGDKNGHGRVRLCHHSRRRIGHRNERKWWGRRRGKNDGRRLLPELMIFGRSPYMTISLTPNPALEAHAQCA